MDTSDLLLSLVIIIIFILLYFYNILGVSIEKIKQFWPLYRCNPAIMPIAGFFGHDPTTNFNNCVQNIESSYMSELLLPINYNINTIKKAGDEINTSVLDTKSFINRFRNDISNIIKNIMGIFLNLTIDAEKSNISIKDILSRLSATLTTLTYYSESTIPVITSAKKYGDQLITTAQASEDAKRLAFAKTQADALAASEAKIKALNNTSEAKIIALNNAQADALAKAAKLARDEALASKAKCAQDVYNTQLVYNKQLQDIIAWYRDRTISADSNIQTAEIKTAVANDACCFHPDTFVKTFDNQIVKIKDLKLTDRLKNGQKIYGIMNLNNLDNSNNFIENLYLLPSGEEHEPIFVSGSHLIFDKSIMNYTHVKNYSESIKTSVNSVNLTCLITSDHTIPLGNYIFHDWEDNNGSPSKDLHD